MNSNVHHTKMGTIRGREMVKEAMQLPADIGGVVLLGLERQAGREKESFVTAGFNAARAGLNALRVGGLSASSRQIARRGAGQAFGATRQAGKAAKEIKKADKAVRQAAGQRRSLLQQSTGNNADEYLNLIDAADDKVTAALNRRNVAATQQDTANATLSRLGIGTPKPAAQAAPKPAAQPAAQATPKPAAQPAAQPATQGAQPKPAAQPATQGATDVAEEVAKTLPERAAQGAQALQNMGQLAAYGVRQRPLAAAAGAGGLGLAAGGLAFGGGGGSAPDPYAAYR